MDDLFGWLGLGVFALILVGAFYWFPSGYNKPHKPKLHRYGSWPVGGDPDGGGNGGGG